MAFEHLSGREQEILRVLIEHYVATAEPVGSRVLATRYRIGLSPATIRNTMQDLEEMGLIRQPHTSAGRVPTDEGYRVFVDNLLEPQPVPNDLARRLREEIAAASKRAVDEILEQTAHVLAGVTSQIGVTLAPSFQKGTVSHIELIPVAERRMLVVLSIQSGLVRTILLEVSSDVDRKTIEATQSALNERLAGQPLGSIKSTAAERMKGDSRADARLVRLFIDAAEDLVERPPGEALHVNGTANLFTQPEFADHEVLGGVLRVIEERTPIVELLRSRGMGEGIVVTIGREVSLRGAEGCSLVSASYQAGRIEGTIGVIGPTRMEYAKLVSVVDYVAKLLSEQIES
ncbi:MAG: heat-inducible transcriptional repressor HrcA [Candidatus Zixiibacteriota bacterium]